jgi:peroxiredoxin
VGEKSSLMRPMAFHKPSTVPDLSLLVSVETVKAMRVSAAKAQTGGRNGVAKLGELPGAFCPPCSQLDL